MKFIHFLELVYDFGESIMRGFVLEVLLEIPQTGRKITENLKNNYFF